MTKRKKPLEGDALANAKSQRFLDIRLSLPFQKYGERVRSRYSFTTVREYEIYITQQALGWIMDKLHGQND